MMIHLQLLVSLLSAYRIGAESVDNEHGLEDFVVSEAEADDVDDLLLEAQRGALTILEGLSMEEFNDIQGSPNGPLERLRRAEANLPEAASPVDPNEAKSELQSILDEMTRTAKSARVKRDGIALLVSNERGETVFDVRTKKMTPWTKRNLASGSKLIAGITLLKCINDTPNLSLESTTGEILGWTKNKDLTIDMLGAFASGDLPGSSDPVDAVKEVMNPNPSVTAAFSKCLMNRFKSTTQCVNEHLKNADFKDPGTSRYEPLGPSHAIVAAMCEKASGRSFMSWFNELKNTFGIKDRDFTYSCPACFDVNNNFPYGNAWQWRKYPSISAGLTATAVHLKKFLTLLVNKGKHEGEQLIAESLILRMGRNAYKGRYGWFSMPEEKTGQSYTFGHSGAWGMKMWANLDVGYSVVLMLMSSPSEKLNELHQFHNMNGHLEKIKKVLDAVLTPTPESTPAPTASPIPTPNPTPSPPPALKRNMKTKGGCTCLSRWTFKGKKYEGCRKTPGNDQPWCRFNQKSCNMWKAPKNFWKGWDWCKSEMVAASQN